MEDRDRDLEREACRLQNIQEAHAKLSEEKEQLEDLLARRNSIITHLFERLEVRADNNLYDPNNNLHTGCNRIPKSVRR